MRVTAVLSSQWSVVSSFWFSEAPPYEGREVGRHAIPTLAPKGRGRTWATRPFVEVVHAFPRVLSFELCMDVTAKLCPRR